MKSILSITIVLFIFTSDTLYSYPASEHFLRVPIGQGDIYNRALNAIRIILDSIGNQVSPLSSKHRVSNPESFRRVVNRSLLFNIRYKRDWNKYINDLQNCYSPAYFQLLEYLKICNDSYAYRFPAQHAYIKQIAPILLKEKIGARKKEAPVYIRLVTLGGEYDPVSIGATLIESIKNEMADNYPNLEFGKDVILEILDIQIDPRVIIKMKKRLVSANEKEFNVKKDTDFYWRSPKQLTEELNKHIDLINKYKSTLNNVTKFTQGSIANNALMNEILKNEPDFIINNLVLYQLSIPHQKNFIDFIGQNAPENTIFIFHPVDIDIAMIACRNYIKSNGDRDIASQVYSISTTYPPLFAKYFKVMRIPDTATDCQDSYSMQKIEPTRAAPRLRSGWFKGSGERSRTKALGSLGGILNDHCTSAL